MVFFGSDVRWERADAMTGNHTLMARVALGGVAAMSSVALAGGGRLFDMASRSFDRLVTLAFLVSRLSLYFVVFFGLGIVPRGDVPAFYVIEAREVLAGKLPYAQFGSSYAPLHGFLDAGVLRLWNSPLALILFAILVEAVAYPLFLRMARRGFSEGRVRVAALLYLTSPVSLQFVAIDGQDNVLIALMLTAAILFLYRGRILLSGAVLALAIVTVKFLPLLFAPLLLLASPRRGRWVLGFGGVLAVGYLPFALLRLPLLYPLQAESQARTASDLPYVVEALFGSSLPGRFEDGLLAVVLLSIVAGFGAALRGATAERRLRLVAIGCATMTLALLLLSKKSWPPYLMLVWFPICLLSVPERGLRLRLFAFAAFSWVAILAHSIWATVFLQALGPDMHRELTAMRPSALVFLVMQLLLVGGYLGLLLTAVQQADLFPPWRRSNPVGAPLVPTCAR